MSVGLLGGAFDPVHCGHLMLAEGALQELGLERVLLIPYAVGPHKPDGPVASGVDRLAMLALAVGGHPRLQVDDREIRRGGPSYTVDTLRDLSSEHPGVEWVLLMGCDQARTLAEWHQPRQVLEMARMAVAPRPGREQGPELLPDGLAGAHRLSLPLPEVSSTDIRLRIARGRSLHSLVPEAVAEYIQEHGLYR